MISRRAAIQHGAVAAAGLLASAACGRVRGDPPSPRRRVPKVRVEENRLIRSMAGLRPYRPSGFVLRAAPLDDRLLIHNYGHGGAGITLSWGCALLAAELAAHSSERAVAVVGAGVIGLTTARVLQDHGFTVQIYARDLPPDTTSNVAGGQWGVYTLYDDAQVTPEFMRQFERAARLAHRRFQDLIGAHYGVRWIEHYVLIDALATHTPLNPIADLQIDSLLLDADEQPFQFRYVRRYYSMLIEPATFLNTLLDEFQLHGGRIAVRQFDDVRQLAGLPERTIVNCTGLGSRALFGDTQLTPVRGQLAVLLPQPEIDYVLLHKEHHMFPRPDGIVLGGTHEPGVWSTTPDARTTRDLLAAHAALMARTR
ncbi:MAG TPA: FAD-dependent oxidoreductase [Longimicrobiales bacterium]